MKHVIDHILLTRNICDTHKEFVNRIKERHLVLTEVIFRVLFVPIVEYLKDDYTSIPIICHIMSYLIENENEQYDPSKLYDALDIKDAGILKILINYTPDRCRIRKVFLAFSPERTR